MSEHIIDVLSRQMADRNTRRQTLRRIAGGVLGGALLGAPALQDAAAACVLPKKKCGKGKKCCAGSVCRSGKCRCKGGLKACSGRCVNTSTNQDHCGACGNVCAREQACQDGQCITIPPPCPALGFKDEQLDPDRRIRTSARLNCDGLLEVETNTYNTHGSAAFRGRVRIVAYDAAGNTWKFPLFSCGTLCSYWDLSCGGIGPKQRIDRFTAFAPADFAQRATSLAIYHAHDRDPLP